MKAYILTEEDFETLLEMIDHDPARGPTSAGRSLNEAERLAYQDAHRFYNYYIHKWMDKVKE